MLFMSLLFFICFSYFTDLPSDPPLPPPPNPNPYPNRNLVALVSLVIHSVTFLSSIPLPSPPSPLQ